MSNLRQYEDAREKCIIRPQKARLGKHFDAWVTIDSENWQKQSLVQIRRYQALECCDGMLMDTSAQCWENAEVYTFTDDYFDKERVEMRQWLIGGVGFSRHSSDEVELVFCWIHPFWRNKGLLRQSWPEFEKRFERFYVSHPRTKAMEGFLLSIRYEEPAPTIR